MSDSKKSFILYNDLIHTVRQMPKDKAGHLFMHILQYVNEENPETDDLIINLTFEPIKQQLIRDLDKWAEIKEKRSAAGIASAEAKKAKQQSATNSTHVESVEQSATNSTVNDSVNENATVNENVINKKHRQITEDEFIQIWKDARKFYDESKYLLITCLTEEERLLFNNLDPRYEIKHFKFAVAGLFSQGINGPARKRPKWLLEPKNFENMIEDWLNNEKTHPAKKETHQSKKEKFQKGDI